MKALYPIAFGVLIVSVFVWFGFCRRLFMLLETRQPEKYNELGRPSLIMNNSISNNIAFMRFLLKREYIELNDPVILNLAQTMRVFVVCYFILFVFLALGVPFGYAP